MRPDPSESTVTVELTKGERFIIESSLRANGCGFALDIAAKIHQTRCGACGGSGYEPYVGGDDDEVPCHKCDGSGHRS